MAQQQWNRPGHVGVGSNGVGSGPGMPGLSMGGQRPFWQQPGPSGDSQGPARGIRPWPYITHFVNFLVTYPYGTANSAALAKPWPYATQVAVNQPIGLYKAPTGSNTYF